jgi:segregation and condensation protein B
VEQTWELKPKIEVLLITSDRPVTIEALALCLDVAKEEVNAALREFEFDLMGADRGMQVRRLPQGIRIATKSQYADLIGRFLPEQKGRPMTTQALETLAIIALKQPVSTGDINAIRGIKIKSERTVLTLRNRKLIAGSARWGPRRENIWRTTQLFLDTFGLDNLDELYKEGRMEEIFASVYSAKMVPKREQLFPIMAGGRW